tara:strand:+ start:9737 stop:10654 length:918 start_codon:yes stop_codon:yes gene_type:complete
MTAYLISDEGNISIVLKGKQYFVNSTDEAHASVIDALRNSKTEDEILMILDKTTQVQDYLEDAEVQIKDGCVVYQGEEVHNTLTEKILSFMRQGLPVQPLVNFLKNMMKNPSFSSRRELFDFLSHKSLPVTEDGCFLAYKAVNSNFKDKHTGTIDNSVGETPTMARFGVDDDRNHGCSAGLHAGTLEYVQGYGAFYEDEEGNPMPNSDQCIIVKINPEDVVSVPTDCNCQKLRTASYEVVKLYEGEMEYTLATDEGHEWDEDYEDWDLEDYIDDNDESVVITQDGMSFRIDTSSLDSFKDKWMNN